jgi:gamma-glutamyltranspeptidase/glutathione hydrolase
MPSPVPSPSLPSLILLILFVFAPAAGAETPRHAAIASAHPLATEAGFEILAAGGNAFDAAVAVSAALAVVEPRGSGVGGGGFYLLHRAGDGHQIMVDAREVAPAAATRDMFVGPDGQIVPRLSLDTALAAGIPGEPAGWAHLAGKYGRLPLAQSLQPAIRLAHDGFIMYPRLVEDIERKQDVIASTPDGRRIFLSNKGSPPPAGTLFRQRDLARSLQVLAREGAEGFYRGRFAQKLVSGVRQLGGIWSLEDLRDYRVLERQPLQGEYRGARIVTAAPPSAGGVTLLQTLNILAGYDLTALDDSTRKHLIAESLRRAHRDRAEYLADPDFVAVPTERLISADYAAGLRATIRLDRAMPSDLLPDIVGGAIDESTQTTHFSVLDREGNRVAATITLNALMGSGLVAPGTGILLNNEMDDFVSKPGEPNLYGLVGGEANTVEPGKRPLSSMTPTFVESERGLMILGTPGGSYIPTMVLLGVLNWLDGADAQTIVSAPRMHHQFRPDVIFYEPRALTEEELEGLKARGHGFRPWPATIGNMQVITWDYAGNRVEAAADPRGVGLGETE